MPPRLHTGMDYPLDVLYAHVGLAAPRPQRLTPARLPAPYRQLLAHDRDMTSTLEGYFADRLAVRVLTTFMRGRVYYRRVLLALEQTGRPVGMGAVALRLDTFPPALRARIVAQREPLGRVVLRAGAAFVSCPEAFFRLTPNAEMLGVFHMPAGVPLYGRQSRAYLDGKAIGHIIEVLPPIEASAQ